MSITRSMGGAVTTARRAVRVGLALAHRRRQPHAGLYVEHARRVVLAGAPERPPEPAAHRIVWRSPGERKAFLRQLFRRAHNRDEVIFDPGGRAFLKCRDCGRAFEIGSPDPKEPMRLMFAERTDQQKGDRFIPGALSCSGIA